MPRTASASGSQLGGIMSPALPRRGFSEFDSGQQQDDEYPPQKDEWSASKPLLDGGARRRSSSMQKLDSASLALLMGSPGLGSTPRPTRSKSFCPSWLLLLLGITIPLVLVYLAGLYSPHGHIIRPLESLRWRKSQPCGMCASSPVICDRFGEESLGMARAYQGSGRRVRALMEKAVAGQQIKTAVIGGSVSEGFGCDPNMRWHEQVADYFNKTFPNSPPVIHINGAIPGRGSDYFQNCHAEHIDQDVDLVVVELGINDFSRNDVFFKDMESLTRSLLSYPKRPAVVFVESFTIFLAQLSTGTDSHLGVANYYDIPFITLRPWLLPAVLEKPELKEVYFWGNRDGTGQHNDYLHVSQLGHNAMADQVKAYFDQQLCLVKNGLGRGPSTAKYPWPDHTLPPASVIPRLRLTDHWSDTEVIPQPNSQCLTLDSANPKNVLKMLPSSHGWYEWEDKSSWRADKKYLRADNVGDRIDFEVDLVSGSWTLYYIKSKKKGLGNVWCWADDDRPAGDFLEGYWDRNMEVGQIRPIQNDLSQGKHIVHCEIIKETLNPDGGHSFFIVALFSA